ncbi:GNAT family N-acetyltransferase [Paracoccus aestuariivivens]|uniref:L-ornithine N(alpha)-acyltransferase n=1 Tax=Paracoccus aestuariivivens TaxID=1820333 RepID=A0A6L6JAU9_9RHOB|nr:GNAT family N-acyltransferase [Paracoccus aestuariivivens]MTH77274.1 GNAT family N-acetyltransferase [Paracoccus aestuariivivens]
MTPDSSYLETRLASTEKDLLSAQRLRYRVFVEELGGDGDLVDHQNRFERDEFDEVVDHLVLIDNRRSEADLDHVVGVYRLLPGDRAERFGRFYCDSEYDLDPLRRSGRSLLELGRSCVDPGIRGGTGMYLLWNALAEYVLGRGIELLFGVASFHGTDAMALAQPLTWLHRNHLADASIRPVARASGYQSMDLIAPEAIDRRAAMTSMPPLIKAYLRLGGTIGEGAYLDHAFNTTDVFLLVDTAAMSTKHKKFYETRWQSQ